MDSKTEEQDSRKLEKLARLLKRAERIVVFTGAGISTKSGIADFRSPGGIWSKITPIQFGDFLADEETRLEDWRRRFHFQPQFDSAPLNDGHRAVADIVNSTSGIGLITQNIDGLHQRSGIADQDIIEIHGNGTRATCLDCQSPMTLIHAKQVIDETGKAPRCLRCDGLVKSAVISFGQPMPQAKMVDAERMALNCDLFLVLGSSLVVQPAASLPIIARNNEAELVIINQQTTPLDAICSLVIHAPLGITLQKALEN